MIKKFRLFSTILVLCFIAIMIPIAIMAASNANTSIYSTLQYLVEDIEGEFYYKLDGNAEAATHDISLATLFYTEKDSEAIVIKNSNGDVLPNNQTIQISPNGILFDESHQTVAFYFIFSNYGENEVEGDDRSVNINVSSANASNFSDYISTTWSYVIKQQNVGSGVFDANIDIDTNANTIEQGDQDFALIDGVTLNPINTEDKYEYIIIKYELNLEVLTETFSTSINLTINLHSNQG